MALWWNFRQSLPPPGGVFNLTTWTCLSPLNVPYSKYFQVFSLQPPTRTEVWQVREISFPRVLLGDIRRQFFFWDSLKSFQFRLKNEVKDVTMCGSSLSLGF